MNWAAPHLATRRVLGWVVQSGGFFRGWSKKVLTKEKMVVIKEKLDSPTGKREEKGTGKGFIMQIASSAAGDGGVDGKGLSDSLIYRCLTRKFQTGPLTLHFYGRLKLQFDRDTKSLFGTMDFSTSDAEQGLVGSWAWWACCPPFLEGKTPASMTFSEFQRAEQLLIKGERIMKPPEARLKGPVVVVQLPNHV